MLRYICLLSFSVSLAWSAEVSYETSPYTLEQTSEAFAERPMVGAAVKVGHNRYRHEPYGFNVPPRPQLMVPCVDHYCDYFPVTELSSPFNQATADMLSSSLNHEVLVEPSTPFNQTTVVAPSAQLEQATTFEPSMRRVMSKRRGGPVNYSYNLTSFGQASSCLLNAKRALDQQYIPRERYEEFLAEYFDYVMCYFNKTYISIKDRPASEVVLSEYIAAGKKAHKTWAKNLPEGPKQLSIKCYEITFLIGAANIAGRLKKNQLQLELAKSAKKLVESLPHDINPAYADGGDLIKDRTLATCEGIIKRAIMFSRSKKLNS